MIFAYIAQKNVLPSGARKEADSFRPAIRANPIPHGRGSDGRGSVCFAARCLAMFALVASWLPLCGCLPNALLITPVSSRQDLVEKELYRDSYFAADKIAIIDVNGLIVNSDRFDLLGRGENPVSLLLEQLDEARKDSRVKAVILRINSPGGGVTASHLMHDEIMRFKRSGKPIVAVMMDVAASGGYDVACACDKIVAQPSTVTGSIGVIMQMIDWGGTMEMIGVSADAITSGAYKAAGSPFRKLRDEERALFQEIVDDMYERFVKVVDSGRPDLTQEAVRKLADGRIFTAGQALEHGLIDGIASMRQTIEDLKKRIGVKKIRLVAYRRPYAYRPNYYALAPASASAGGDINLVKLDMPLLANGTTPRFMYLWSPGR